jgi:GNAT superfamily N-acetyltransferase
VTRNAEGLAVSGYACSPRRMLHRGDEATLASVGETGDVMTHPDWRKRGLFSDLDRAAMEATRRRGWPLVFGLPNRRSAHIFLKLGWEQVGTVRPYTFVLKADAASREVRKREGRVAALTTGIGARKGRRARVLQGQAAAGLEARPLERFPDQVEDLSRRIEPCFGVMVRRDAAYLNWRFTDAPSGLHRRVGLFDGEELAAYVVVQVPRPGDAGGFLVDLLGRDEAAVRAAFGSGLEALEQAGASYAEATAMDGSWWAERLLENGFLPPKAENHLTVILHVHDAEHPLVAAAREPKRWYFTDGDRDDETLG